MALYCYNFALNSVLKIQQCVYHDEKARYYPSKFITVISESPILVYPTSSEILRNAKPDEQFQSYYEEYSRHEDYIAIVFQGDLAYLAKDSCQVDS